MPHRIEWKNNGLISSYTGEFTNEIHRTALLGIFADPRIDSLDFIIGDFSQVSGDLITEDESEFSAALTKGASGYMNKNLKLALVACDKRVIDLCNKFIKLNEETSHLTAVHQT